MCKTALFKGKGERFKFSSFPVTLKKKSCYLKTETLKKNPRMPVPKPSNVQIFLHLFSLQSWNPIQQKLKPSKRTNASCMHLASWTGDSFIARISPVLLAEPSWVASRRWCWWNLHHACWMDGAWATYGCMGSKGISPVVLAEPFELLLRMELTCRWVSPTGMTE